jgi:hypothetical protein
MISSLSKEFLNAFAIVSVDDSRSYWNDDRKSLRIKILKLKKGCEAIIAPPPQLH